MPLSTIIAYPPVPTATSLKPSSFDSSPEFKVLKSPLPPASKGPIRATHPDNISKHQNEIQAVIRHLERHEGLTEDEMMYLSQESIIRFLAAEKYHTRNTIIRLENHLAWRRKLGVDDVRAMVKEIAPEMECGKMFTLSYARDGSPLIFMTPSKNNTEPSTRQVKNTMFVIERAVDLMRRDVDEVAMIVDLGGKIKQSSGSLSVMRQILSSCQSNYPERLRWCVVRNIPLLSRVLINLMWPFIDPYTKSKLHFDVPVAANGRVDPAALPKQAGGDLDFEYDSKTYLPSLVDLCIQRREGNKQRWKAAGGRLGSSERVWRWDPTTDIGRDGMSIDTSVQDSK